MRKGYIVIINGSRQALARLKSGKTDFSDRQVPKVYTSLRSAGNAAVAWLKENPGKENLVLQAAEVVLMQNDKVHKLKTKLPTLTEITANIVSLNQKIAVCRGQEQVGLVQYKLTSMINEQKALLEEYRLAVKREKARLNKELSYAQ